MFFCFVRFRFVLPQEKNRKLNGQLEGLLSEALDRDALELRLAKVLGDDFKPIMQMVYADE